MTQFSWFAGAFLLGMVFAFQLSLLILWNEQRKADKAAKLVPMNPPTGGSSVVKPNGVITTHVVLRGPDDVEKLRQALAEKLKKPPTWWRP